MFRSRGVVTAFAILSLCAFTVGCGGGDDATEEQLQQAREDGAKEAEAQAKLDQLEKQVDQLAKKNKQGADNSNQSTGDSSSSVAPSGSATALTECTDGVKAGPNTSCDFAMNVAGEYGSNPGASSIKAYSPVTGEQYSMYCASSGVGTVCSGGKNASVFIP